MEPKHWFLISSLVWFHHRDRESADVQRRLPTARFILISDMLKDHVCCGILLVKNDTLYVTNQRQLLRQNHLLFFFVLFFAFFFCAANIFTGQTIKKGHIFFFFMNLFLIFFTTNILQQIIKKVFLYKGKSYNVIILFVEAMFFMNTFTSYFQK